MNVEIEFLEWVHPKAGITKVQMEDGKPLVLKAKIKHEWVGLTSEDIYDCDEQSKLPKYEITNADLQAFAYAIEAKLKEKNAL